MKRRSYTLVEILMVVGIIAILVGLAIPVLNSARSSARLNKASAECNAIALAIKNFEAEYGQMPNPAAASDGASAPTATFNNLYAPTDNELKQESDVGTTSAYYKLFTMLTMYDPSNHTQKITSGYKNNVKKMVFLDPPPSYAEGKTYLDPWGKPYTILYRVDGESSMEFSLYAGSSEVNDRKIKLLTPIAVYTGEGLPGNITVTETTRYATSWGGIVTKPE